MKKQFGHGPVVGVPATSFSFSADPKLSEEVAPVSPEPVDRKESLTNLMSMLSRKADNYVQGIRKHVTLRSLKEKLNLGTRILKKGGGAAERAFQKSFSIGKGEKLVKASQCHLWTTAGPIAGMLFISTENVAFLSHRSIKLTTPKGDTAKVLYKVLIPLTRIKRVIPSKNSNSSINPSYIQIVTVDKFEFWFMGFMNYYSSLKQLQQATSEFISEAE